MKNNYKKGNAVVGLLIWGLIIWGGVSLFSGTDNEEYTRSYNSASVYNSYDYTYPDESSDTDYYYDDDYKYNYRSGSSGSYDYNYDVSGYGDTGYVYGEVDTSGKYGDGYVYDEYGNEVYIETEWTSYGVLEAYDDEGNWYELEVE